MRIVIMEVTNIMYCYNNVDRTHAASKQRTTAAKSIMGPSNSTEQYLSA